MSADYPIFDGDPFSREVLTNPDAMHEELRELGPVVWLSKYGIWGMARYEQVHATLMDWRTFCSSAGVGLADFRKEKPWRSQSIILEADPPLHTRSRAVLSRVLSPAALRKLKDTFVREAEELVDRVVRLGQFDAMLEIARHYPTKVFGDALGLAQDGRENLIPFGNLAFNAIGPRNWLMEEGLAGSEAVIGWIMSKCRRDALSSDGLGAQIFAAADTGELSEEEASLLVRGFLTAGVDTTVNALGGVLYCLAAHPEGWALLREDPKLARAAFEEALRLISPVQIFFRTTTRPVNIDGIDLEEGQKVLLFLGAANRDPRRWDDPLRFDIRRRNTGHVGFGVGIHGCVGQMVARMEGEAILTALAQRAATFKLAGEPRPHLNNGLRAFESLPVEVRPSLH